MATKFNWESAVPFIEPQITNRGVHVWPFNPSFPLDVRFLLLNRKQDVPMHRPDHLELIYIESGEVLYQYQERQLLLHKGDIVLVGNNAYHRCRKSTDSRPQRSAVISFLPEVIRAAGEASDEGIRYLLPFSFEASMLPCVLRGQTEISTQIFDLIQRIHAELPQTSEWSQLAVKTYLKMILVLLGNCLQNEWCTHQARVAVQHSVRRLRPVFELVENHFADPLTVEDAANVAGLSRWHFMRLFKQVTGQSFVDYIRHFRISKAQEFLVSTQKSISDVSQQTGFCDQSYFGTVFRALANMTPLTYRRRFGETANSSTLSLCLSQPASNRAWALPSDHKSEVINPRLAESASLQAGGGQNPLRRQKISRHN